MSQVLRINSTDPRVAYGGQWTTNWIQNGTSSSASNDAEFFLLFRGTNIRVYGGSVGDVNWQMSIDGIDYSARSQGTLDDIRPSPVFSMAGMDDADHQILMRMLSLPANARIFLDHFEIENSSGGGLDLLSVGSTSPQVPAQAETVDNTSPDIDFQNLTLWNFATDISCYQGTRRWLLVPGNSFSYSFDGVALWYYSRNGPDLAAFTVSIDGSTPQRVNATSKVGVNQSMLWSNSSLGVGRHNITFTHDDTNGRYFGLDFLRVLHPEDASALTSTPQPTGINTVGSINKTNKVPLAVGLTLGLLAIIIIVLGGVYYLHRRRRKPPVDLDARPISSVSAVRPMTQADQQPRFLPFRKHRPRSAELAEPSGSSIAATNLVTETGPPPSYEAI